MINHIIIENISPIIENISPFLFGLNHTHNQLLSTKFYKEFCHSQPMTSKVQPVADY